MDLFDPHAKHEQIEDDPALALELQQEVGEASPVDDAEAVDDFNEDGTYNDPKKPEIRRKKRARTETPPTLDIAGAATKSSLLKWQSRPQLIGQGATDSQTKLNGLKQYLSGNLFGGMVSQVTESCGTEMIKNALLLGYIECERLHVNIVERLKNARKKNLLIHCDIWEELDIKFSTDADEFRNSFAGFNQEQLVAQMAAVRREIAWLKDNRDDFLEKLYKPNPENKEYEFSLRNDANEDRSNADRRKNVNDQADTRAER